MTEQAFEKLLNIKTSGEQKIFNESAHYHRYEPTCYSVLEELGKQYTFTPKDHVVDFGSGKGRLNFYIHHFFGSSVTGIEMNTFFYKQGLDNHKEYLKKYKPKGNKITFFNSLAEDYQIQSANNKFYFFNPFSIQIFIKIVGNILLSIEESKRTVDIILYYPSYEYRSFLENNTPFVLFQEIKLPCFSANDPRHSFLIYRLAAGTNS